MTTMNTMYTMISMYVSDFALIALSCFSSGFYPANLLTEPYTTL
jgi:hypothetical protein